MDMLQQLGQDLMGTYPKKIWMKMMYKAPIVLWRMGLGPLMGRIFVLITTTGRKSGLPRHTLAEYFVLDGKLYVVCAYGAKADWYKNMMANPYVTIQTWQGAERVKATRVTNSEELLDILKVIQKRNSVMSDWYFESLGIDGTPEAILENKAQLYIIRFDPTLEPTPFPLEADLAWLWPVLLLSRMVFSRRRE